MTMNVKLLTPESKLPKRAHCYDAGADLYATSVSYDHRTGVITYGTGIAIETLPATMSVIAPRSSVYRTGLCMCNSIGIVDQGYTGEVMVKFYRNRPYTTEAEFVHDPDRYQVGERIAQLIVVPIFTPDFTPVEELAPSERGNGGYGSTGNK